MGSAQLTEQIRVALATGKRKEEIYQELLAQGTTLTAIEAGFDSLIQETAKSDSHKWAVRVIVSIGALLVAAGIFSFVAANWQEIGRMAKVGIVLTAMAVSYGLGFYLKEYRSYARSGEALILLGAISYGAGIFLVAQLFHVQVEWPDGFLLWMLGTLAMAIAIDSYLLYYLSLPLGFAGLVGLPSIMFELFWSRGISATFISISLLIISALCTFATGWIIRRRMPDELKQLY